MSVVIKVFVGIFPLNHALFAQNQFVANIEELTINKPNLKKSQSFPILNIYFDRICSSALEWPKFERISKCLEMDCHSAEIADAGRFNLFFTIKKKDTNCIATLRSRRRL